MTPPLMTVKTPTPLSMMVPGLEGSKIFLKNWKLLEYLVILGHFDVCGSSGICDHCLPLFWECVWWPMSQMLCFTGMGVCGGVGKWANVRNKMRRFIEPRSEESITVMVGQSFRLDPSRETNEVDITLCSPYAKTNTVKKDKGTYKYSTKVRKVVFGWLCLSCINASWQ